jgi:hypothetical protein
MPTFNRGETVVISLDYDDVVNFSGDANAKLASVGGDKYFFVTGNQRLGPYKEVSTLTLTTMTAGSYSIANDSSVYGYTRAVVNDGGVTTGFISDTGVVTTLSGGATGNGFTGATYDGSNRVTGYSSGGNTYTVTYPTSTSIVVTGGGTTTTITLDGSGRITSVVRV